LQEHQEERLHDSVTYTGWNASYVSRNFKVNASFLVVRCASAGTERAGVTAERVAASKKAVCLDRADDPKFEVIP